MIDLDSEIASDVDSGSVDLGLAQLTLQAVHSLQRIGLLVDEDEEQLVLHR